MYLWFMKSQKISSKFPLFLTVQGFHTNAARSLKKSWDLFAILLGKNKSAPLTKKVHLYTVFYQACFLTENLCHSWHKSSAPSIYVNQQKAEHCFRNRCSCTQRHKNPGQFRCQKLAWHYMYTYTTTRLAWGILGWNPLHRIYVNLKVGTNEKVDGSGRPQMFGIVLGPWWWMFFPFLILPPSCNKSISFSALLQLIESAMTPMYWWKHVSSTNRQRVANRQHQQS